MAIDNATRIRALKIYDRHNQESAIDFINKFTKTDNGHKCRTEFQWRLQELGMIYVHIKPAAPRLNGKVERTHLTDQQ